MQGPVLGVQGFCLLRVVLGQAFEDPEQGGAMGKLAKTSKTRSDLY